jgi:hypothetical protein
MAKEKVTLSEKEGLIAVSKTVLKSQTEKKEKIRIRPFVTPTSTVAVKYGRTINIGNYENVKVEVFVAAPCYMEEIVDVYNQVRDLCAEFIEKEIDDLMNESSREGTSKS